jgi:hypothetical protein
MTAHRDDAACTGAGVRKPPGKETAVRDAGGWGSLWRLYERGTVKPDFWALFHFHSVKPDFWALFHFHSFFCST